jgi:hypothetical protein
MALWQWAEKMNGEHNRGTLSHSIEEHLRSIGFWDPPALGLDARGICGEASFETTEIHQTKGKTVVPYLYDWDKSGEGESHARCLFSCSNRLLTPPTFFDILRSTLRDTVSSRVRSYRTTVATIMFIMKTTTRRSMTKRSSRRSLRSTIASPRQNGVELYPG